MACWALRMGLSRSLCWASGLLGVWGGGASPLQGGGFQVKPERGLQGGPLVGSGGISGSKISPSLSLAGIEAALCMAGFWLGWPGVLGKGSLEGD